MFKFINILVLQFLLIWDVVYSYQCNRIATHMIKPPNQTPLYILEISGNPSNYVPGEIYTITVRNNPKYPYNGRFRDFEIVAESTNRDPLQFFTPPSSGHFKLIDSMLTGISTKCRNTVIQTNNVLKSSVQVEWIAPRADNGCLEIKATIIESEDNWFAPDDSLTRKLCEEDSQDADVQPSLVETCCACDEAKYEIAFQGMWSRNTHPRLYPVDIWTTKFSDIIGASHQYGKAFWNYGDFASEGLKMLAEDGDTNELETELKEMASEEYIRTIIKARELSYPNITGISYTVFRVDRENHLLSLVSKITPSPDWIVGVANLELCLENCSWVESRVLNLYPWDVGTDSAISYTSAKQPLSKPEMIKMIKPNSPNDPNAPFFNEDGEPIKPLARLHITREKLYEQDCPTVEKNEAGCKTTKWSNFTKCGPDCYKTRTREYKNHKGTAKCNKPLFERRRCKQCTSEAEAEADVEQDACEATEWSEWSSCSENCGKGTRTRDRKLKNPNSESDCSAIVLQEDEECAGAGEDCPSTEETPEEDCPNVKWDVWTDCSVECGNGVKRRIRVMVDDNEDADPPEEGPCANLKQEEIVECYNPPCNPFGEISTGNQLGDGEVVFQAPTGSVVDCEVTSWSIWGPCNTTETCTHGYRFSSRIIKTHASNGGKPCPKKLLRKRKCVNPCHSRKGDHKENIVSSEDRTENDTIPTWGEPAPKKNSNKVDCVMGNWSRWSPCTKSCGSNAVQLKTRPIITPPSNGGAECGIRKLERKCKLPLACTSSGRLPIFR